MPIDVQPRRRRAEQPRHGERHRLRRRLRPRARGRAGEDQRRQNCWRSGGGGAQVARGLLRQGGRDAGDPLHRAGGQ